jgi:hypothetical protein
MMSFVRFGASRIVIGAAILEVTVKRLGILLLGFMLTGQMVIAQKTSAKSKTTKPAMAEWTPEVQQTLGVTSGGFAASGLNKLTKVQLTALLVSAKPDPKKHVLTCVANAPTPGIIHVLLKIAGEDATDKIQSEIRSRIAGLAGVMLVDQPADADVALHVVVQEQTTAKKTIGFTASYETGTPCRDEVSGNTTDVELKGQLGIYTEPKSADLARDLAAMLNEVLKPLRAANPS